MKSLVFPLLVAVAVVSPAQVKPASKKRPVSPGAITMPAEVRASFPRTATSLYFGRQSIGLGGSPVLVHLWVAGRKPSSEYPHQFQQSPFCLDLFVIGDQRSETPRKWTRVSSTVYVGEDGPRNRKDVSARWLYTRKKQAPVLIFVSPSYMSTRYTVITYPKGIFPDEGGELSPSYVQDFYQGGIGGGKTVTDFGTDKNGILTVLAKGFSYGHKQKTATFAWNGHEYALAPATHK